MGPLRTVVFVCGACVMVMELVGSRLFAPYLGTSLFIWTSLIGVILGCLSLGYWAGGVLADRYPQAKGLAGVLFFSGLFVAAVALLGDRLLFWVQSTGMDIRIGAVGATLVLFGVPSTLMGMVSPYAVRLCLSRVDKSGSTAGNLYALSTLGSIAGTFLAGFYLMSFFSHTSILYMVSLTLLALAPLAAAGKTGRVKAAAAFLAVLGLSATEPFVQSVMGEGFVEAHTAYNRVWIYNGFIDDKPARVMQLNDTGDSAMYLESDDLAFDYTRYFRLGGHFRPDVKRALMIGGAAYSYPKHFLKEFPQASIDVVEIDPDLTRLAKEHFGLKDDARMRIFHEDARTFLNRPGERYELILGDVYKSYSVPFQLATREAMERIHDRLDDRGVFLMNVIASIEGPNGRFTRALLATLDGLFPQILVFAVTEPESGTKPQNLLIAAFKSKERLNYGSTDSAINGMISHLWMGTIPRDIPAMTDSLAPVERYTADLIANHPGRKNGILQKSLRQDTYA